MERSAFNFYSGNHSCRRKRRFSILAKSVGLFVPIALLAACGSGSNSNPGPSPTQKSYPQTPPVAITWTPATSNLPAPPDLDATQPPLSTGSGDFPLTISQPTDGGTVTSPAHVVASATPTNPIFYMRVYVDTLAVYFTFNSSIDTQIWMSPGKHQLEVMAEDNQGYVSAAIYSVTVSSQGQNTISNIQDMSQWQNCSADFPAGSGRAGQVCASGTPGATSTLTPNQTSPAMDGQSADFHISGPAYSNMLYFNPVEGGNQPSHFTYDLYFYLEDPTAPQALEFDINQGVGGVRWVWGSECNFKGESPGMWDIWDDANFVWRETNVPCDAFPANTWTHLVWNVERVGNQVHYISLEIGDQTYNVDTYYDYQQNWTLEEIDVAFQMDIPDPAQSYDVWLDEVKLTAY